MRYTGDTGISFMEFISNLFSNHKQKTSILKAILVLILAIMILYPAMRYYWREHRWRWIVIHHTGSDTGDLAFLKKEHQGKGWHDVAYHFVINNGSRGTIAGQIEESDRWHKREGAGSTKRDHINTYGIAVVMVGNLHKHAPSEQQKEALVNLLIRLSNKYNISVENIRGHREIQNTKCPGKYLEMQKLRQLISNQTTQE